MRTPERETLPVSQFSYAPRLSSRFYQVDDQSVRATTTMTWNREKQPDRPRQKSFPESLSPIASFTLRQNGKNVKYEKKLQVNIGTGFN